MVLALRVHAATQKKCEEDRDKAKKIEIKQEKKRRIQRETFGSFLGLCKDWIQMKMIQQQLVTNLDQNKHPRVDESNGDNSCPETND